MLQELTGHGSHINCVSFDIEGHFLFSGDNLGSIKMWESPEGLATGLESSTDSYAAQHHVSWDLKRDYQVDTGESAVCKPAPHPGRRRLLVHSLHPSHPLQAESMINEMISFKNSNCLYLL